MKPLLDVLMNRTPKRRPIWIMRQAGRYLPEYKKVRQTAGSFLRLCYNPELACEVTLQPLRRFDLDAAILFSDILVVPHAMGLSLDFREGEGPVLETVSSMVDVERLSFQGPIEQFERVWETVGLVRAGLAPHLSLIGFCGAPWTVASYMIEGGSSDRKRFEPTAGNPLSDALYVHVGSLTRCRFATISIPLPWPKETGATGLRPTARPNTRPAERDG